MDQQKGGSERGLPTVSAFVLLRRGAGGLRWLGVVPMLLLLLRPLLTACMQPTGPHRVSIHATWPGRELPWPRGFPPSTSAGWSWLSGRRTAFSLPSSGCHLSGCSSPPPSPPQALLHLGYKHVRSFIHRPANGTIASYMHALSVPVYTRASVCAERLPFHAAPLCEGPAL